MRILIAEECRVTRHMLQNFTAGWGFDPICVDDGEAAWDQLNRPAAPQIVVIERTLPGLDGPALCRRLRAVDSNSYVYVLMVTSDSVPQRVIEGLESGADDYLYKPFQPSELELRLNAGRRIIQLQHRLLKTQQRLMTLATKDALTGLWNRSAILEIFDSELARVARGHGTLGLMMIDIDHFKSVNDRHGHLFGDHVLIEVAQRIEQTLRNYDSVGRYGGEEFLTVLPNVSDDVIRTVAQRVCDCVRDLRVSEGAVEVSPTVSIGVTTLNANTLVESSTAIAQADRALYEAKAQGRDRVQIGRSDGNRPIPPQPRLLGRSPSFVNAD